MLRDVLRVPDLRCNLLSVAELSKDKNVVFDTHSCKILDADNKVLVTGNRRGNLYYLGSSSAEATAVIQGDSLEELWHRRYGHLGVQNMKKLVSENMDVVLDCKMDGSIGVYEPCIQGKHHHMKFPTDGDSYLLHKSTGDLY